MPKIKVPKSAPGLDMTPMVDLAFLLVTFFMLTAKFRNMEPIEADPPSATSFTQLPENVLLITIDTAGRAYYDISGRGVRTKLVERMMARYPGVKLNETQIENFSKMGTFGQPFELLGKYIDGDEEMKSVMDEAGKGIPLDSLNNQLGDWILEGYAAFVADFAEAHPKLSEQEIKDLLKKEGLRYAIKADGNTDYERVKNRYRKKLHPDGRWFRRLGNFGY